ncbi:hypothetical protein IID22_05370 [Patescibacteria group bacterium]|nr:hypothetical protein [Patescibacteria group bacterium]
MSSADELRILFFAFFALLTGQFIAGASLFSPLLNISYSLAVVLLGIGTLLYLLLGGFKAVIKTDLLQFIVMTVVFLIVVFSINLGEFQPGQLSLVGLDSLSAISLFLIGMFTIFAAPDVWQRLFSAKSIKIAKKATFLSAAGFLIFGIILSLIGIAARNNFPGIDSSEALFYGMFQLMPEAFLGLAVISILAAIMSTIDTELFYLSSSLAKDFSRHKNKKGSEELKQIIYRSLIVLAGLSMLLAIFISNILLLLFALLSLTLCVAPAVMASFIWKLKSNAVFLSMAASLASFLILLVIGQLNPETSAITLPTAIVFLVIGQVIFKKDKKEFVK